MQQQQQQQSGGVMQAPAVTEVVDKSLIEKLILEHSERLELEINHKARADAWKFYFRVRIDHVLRPFAVCKVCYRVLHCDSRSGTASLLRHPCNPLSERSPVNRAVRLNAKLKLPPDNAVKKETILDSIKGERGDNNDSCNSPTTCPSPTSTGSPPTQNSTRKRKAGPPPPAFPLDVQLLPQILAAASSPNPLAALYLGNLANAMNDPQHFHQQLQQQIQQIQIDNILREHQQQQQHQQQLKEQQEQQLLQQQQLQQQTPDDSKRWCGSPLEPSSSSSLSLQSEENEPASEDPGRELPKEMVQHLVNIGSNRISLVEKNPPAPNGAWPRYMVVLVDGIQRNFAACKSCRKVVTYSRYTGTGGLLRHRCQASSHQSLTPPHDTSPPPLVRCDVAEETLDTYRTPHREIKTEENGTTHPTMAGIARALLRYMCQDLVPGSSIDSPGFQQLVTTLINLGASHGSLKEGIQSVPSTQLLLEEHLRPLAAVSRDKSARLLQDQPHLCLSCHRPDSELLAVAAHFVTPQFQLKSHALGTRKVSVGDSTEDTLTALLSECLQESPSLLRERHLTFVSDDGFSTKLGTQVPCLWHATERTLAELNNLPAYLRVSNDTTALLEFLADSGVPGAGQPSRDTPRWEALLHALTFVAANYNQVLMAVRASSGPTPDLGDQGGYQELANLLGNVRRCLTSIRATERPTLNQAVLCRAKLIHLCTAPANTTACKLLQEQLLPLFQVAFKPSPLHLVASFLDPRFKSLKVLSDSEKIEVHRLVLDMMKAVAVTEANTGVLNLKTTRRSASPPPASCGSSPSTSISPLGGTNLSINGSSNGVLRVNYSPSEQEGSPEAHPFREYMDNPGGQDLSVSDSEEIMAYVNMKVHLDDDDILSWWAGGSANGLPTLRKLARRVLAIPATCSHAHDIGQRAVAATAALPSAHQHRLNDILHVTYNL